MTEKKFKVGDLVQLKSGSATMTVLSVGCLVECLYFEGTSFKDIAVDSECLNIVEPEPTRKP